MTNQHPLTNKLAEEISCFDLSLWGEAGDGIKRDIRAGADWQLEQVIEWVKHCRGYRLELASETWNFVQDLKEAMRPQENNS
jgi:hypothetical protein